MKTRHWKKIFITIYSGQAFSLFWNFRRSMASIMLVDVAGAVIAIGCLIPIHLPPFSSNPEKYISGAACTSVF